MSNTIIQIKHSSLTPVPAQLEPGEFGYSYSSDKLFIGNESGNTAIVIGGRAIVDNQNTILIVAQTAYNQANVTRNHANNAFSQANTAYTHSIAAFNRANNSLEQTGGTISGSLQVTGDLTVLGNTYSVNSEQLTVKDPLLVLANSNPSDILDIGIVGAYKNTSSINVFTGVFRDATTKKWYVFDQYSGNMDTNHINTSGNNFTIGTLNAVIEAPVITLGSANLEPWLLSISLTANTGFTHANAAFTFANTTYTHANNAYNRANSALTIASSAFDKANTGTTNASALSEGTVPSARLSGSYTGITGLGTITTGVWNGSTIQVSYGGTGRTTVTLNGILYGNGTGPMSVTNAGTEGQVLQVSAAGVPFFGHISCGTF